MCKPVNAQNSAAFDVRSAEFSPERIGPCGRRCSECRISALTASLIANPAARLETSTTSRARG